MKKSFCIFALLAGAVYASHEKPRLKFVDPSAPCRKKSSRPILSNALVPLEPVTAPEQWIWNDIDGTSYLTNIRN